MKRSTGIIFLMRSILTGFLILFVFTGVAFAESESNVESELMESARSKAEVIKCRADQIPSETSTEFLLAESIRCRTEINNARVLEKSLYAGALAFGGYAVAAELFVLAITVPGAAVSGARLADQLSDFKEKRLLELTSELSKRGIEIDLRSQNFENKETYEATHYKGLMTAP